MFSQAIKFADDHYRLNLQSEQLSVYYAHDNRISCLEVSPDGTAVATGSWDNTLRVSET